MVICPCVSGPLATVKLLAMVNEPPSSVSVDLGAAMGGHREAIADGDLAVGLEPSAVGESGLVTADGIETHLDAACHAECSTADLDSATWIGIDDFSYAYIQCIGNLRQATRLREAGLLARHGCQSSVG